MLEKYEQLKIENHACKKQIAEMEIFLADYGMEWKGYCWYDVIDQDNINDTSNMNNHNYDNPVDKNNKVYNHSKASQNQIYFDIKLLLNRIEELNSLVDYTTVVTTTNGNSKRKQAKFSMFLYMYYTSLMLVMIHMYQF